MAPCPGGGVRWSARIGVDRLCKQVPTSASRRPGNGRQPLFMIRHLINIDQADASRVADLPSFNSLLDASTLSCYLSGIKFLKTESEWTDASRLRKTEKCTIMRSARKLKRERNRIFTGNSKGISGNSRRIQKQMKDAA